MSLSVACFRAGTRIATPLGEVSVEHLRRGDQVISVLDGERVPAPVKWIGWRAIDCRRFPTPGAVWPVRVHRGAFAAQSPSRDLWLSPNHAVFIKGVLIPIHRLINGETICQARMDRVVYYHLELDQHDVVLAEGLACKSYLDTGDRADFANGGAAIRLHPSFALLVGEAVRCARLMVVGPEVEQARARLAYVPAWLRWNRGRQVGAQG